MNNKKYYLIANLARSYDGNDKIHLVSSVYYSENIIIKAVKSFKQIIYIYKDDVNRDTQIYEQTKLGEDLDFIKIHFSVFFGFLEGEIEYSSENSVVSLLFKENGKSLINNNYLNKTIFIFENMSWDLVQMSFRNRNIQLSGGSITKRQYLSKTQYQLLTFLLLTKLEYKEFNIHIEKHLDFKKNIKNYNEEIKYFEIYNIKGIVRYYISEEINSLQNNIDIYRNTIEKAKEAKDFIESLKKIEIVMREKIKIRDSIDSDLISKEELKNYYFKNYHNQEINKYTNIFKKLVIDTNKKLSRGSSRSSVNNKLFYLNIGNTNRKLHSLSYTRNYSTDNTVKKNDFNINSPIFIELQRIINNSPLDNNTQMKIETFLNDQGQILLSQRLSEETELNYHKFNPIIINYFKNSIEKLNLLIDNYRVNIRDIYLKDKSVDVEFKVLTSLSNEKIISQLLGRLLRIISNNNIISKNNSTELALDLVESLLNYYYYLEYKAFKADNLVDDNYGLSQFIKDHCGKVGNYSSFQLFGFKLFNFLEEIDLIHMKYYYKEKNKSISCYVCNEKIINDIGKSFEFLDISYKIPMIVPPKEYKRENGRDVLGGYLLNDNAFVLPLIIKNPELKEQSYIYDDNMVFETVNNLSSVGYKINIPVLDFVLEKGVEYGLITNPEFKHPLENKKKLTSLENKTLDSFLSKKQLEMNIIGLSLIFKNVPEFFIPVRIDNRGRIYCIADKLNYQGTELAKALLLFSQGETIKKCDTESIDYLKIFGANCFGNGIDKKSYNDRVEWVNKNEDDILNFRNGKLIKEADSKLLFIAFCFEYINYYNSLSSNESSYTSHFPIQLDATCNGYQHLSLLTGDEPLAHQLNLTESDKNTKPKDFYEFVALKINDYLYEELNRNRKMLSQLGEKEKDKIIEANKIIRSCENLLKLNFNRSLVKTPMMVKAYNAGRLTMIDYLKEKFDKVIVSPNNEKDFLESVNNTIKEKKEIVFQSKSNKDVTLNYFDFNLLIQTMEIVISNEFPKLKEFKEYLEQIARICFSLNIPITWALPNGLKVSQDYVDSEAIRLKPFKFRKKTFNIKVFNSKPNKSKQKRALMPNLVHSLDAASLCLLQNMIYQDFKLNNKKFNFFAIHDCFAVTANNVSKLIKFIQLVYIKIYSDNNYLLTFDKGIINNIKLIYGEDSFDHVNNKIYIDGEEYTYPNVYNIIVGRIKVCQIKKANNLIN